jgi:Rrf2 family protein
MKLSTRTRYGLRAIIELAENGSQAPLQTKAIARSQEISVKYLEQLMTILRSAGFVRSVRGSKGGYMLARSPNQIKLSDVFDCLEGHVTTVECVEDTSFCERAEDCVARQVWAQVQQAIKNVLQSITLQDMVDRTRCKKMSNYQI